MNDAPANDAAVQCPGIVFTMRYGSDIGYVWRTVAAHRDLVARDLGGVARCHIAYPQLAATPAYAPRWLIADQADFYDYSPDNRARLAAYVRARAIRAVVFMSAQPTAVDLAFLRGLGLRTVTTEDDSYDHAQRQSFLRRGAKFAMRRLLRRQLHGLHIANSQAQYDFLRRFAQIPRSRLAMIRNGVDTERFHPPSNRAEAYAEAGLDPAPLWIMAASQARAEKRLELIIAAARRVIAARPGQDIRFFYIGDGAARAQWETAAADLGERFLFLGARADLAPFYRAADIFVHAAFRESFGLVIAEAMSSACPVVATFSHGPGEVIRDGETGFLVGRDDIDGLTTALLRHADDPDLRRRHGAAGRARCVAAFSIERQAAQFAAVLKAVVA